MSVDRIEALVDAIGSINGVHNPESDCYKLRNPLLCRSFSRPGKHMIDDQGRRVFATFLAGYKACTYDVKLKASGMSRAGLKPHDTITNLLGVYGIKEDALIRKVTNFLKRALDCQTLSANTPLEYFLEHTENGAE